MQFFIWTTFNAIYAVWTATQAAECLHDGTSILDVILKNQLLNQPDAKWHQWDKAFPSATRCARCASLYSLWWYPGDCKCYCFVREPTMSSEKDSLSMMLRPDRPDLLQIILMRSKALQGSPWQQCQKIQPIDWSNWSVNRVGHWSKGQVSKILPSAV